MRSKQLLTVEKEWVPSAPGTSLYIRPTIIATDPFLGVTGIAHLPLLHHFDARWEPTMRKDSIR